MNKFRFTLQTLAVLVFTLAFVSLAQAQATRTWVSGVGDDANPCSRTAPCKTFAGAISKTFIGGEIDAMDFGGFGAVTVTKSITIDGGAAFASILASGTQGVIVNVGVNANDPERRVTLRRLSINGTGASGAVGQRTGTKGINFIAGKSLYVENCYIQAFSQEGINVALTADQGFLSVKDTNIQNTNVGVSMTTSTGTLVGIFDRMRVERISTTGVAVGPHTHLSLRDSFIMFNGGDGISINPGSTDSSVFTEACEINHNNTAIRNGAAGSSVILSNTTVQGNTTGLATAGGSFTSHGNNQFSGNSSNGPLPPPIGQQ